MKPHSGNKYNVIGAMSGTSLDGLDLAAVEFTEENGKYSFSITVAETVDYSYTWCKKLVNAPPLSGKNLIKLHSEYGSWIGRQILKFIYKTGFRPDIIASHGHTVFHQPESGFTFQLGSGHTIAATTKITTVSDFRPGDVALGGQGAPLVPAGDRLLFGDFDYCLNLGGFANISFEKDNKRMAFDICPVNFILNYFAAKKAQAFDKDGEMGKKGTVQPLLLDKLNSISFYNQPAPKSLGREWMERSFFPVLSSVDFPDADKLRTVYEHIALQISKAVSGNGKMLVTGGGAFNNFLIERIQNHTSTQLVVPPAQLINFKEALIFAFLGLLRIQNKINCYASVSGAEKDSSAGIIYLP